MTEVAMAAANGYCWLMQVHLRFPVRDEEKGGIDEKTSG